MYLVVGLRHFLYFAFEATWIEIPCPLSRFFGIYSYSCSNPKALLLGRLVLQRVRPIPCVLRHPRHSKSSSQQLVTFDGTKTLGIFLKCHTFRRMEPPLEAPLRAAAELEAAGKVWETAAETDHLMSKIAGDWRITAILPIRLSSTWAFGGPELLRSNIEPVED